LEGVELKEKLRAKKALIVAHQSETEAAIARTMANEAIRAEYAASAEKVLGDMRTEKNGNP